MEDAIDLKPEIIGYRVCAEDGTITHLMALPADFQFVGFMKTSDEILSCIYVPAGPTGNRPILQIRTRKGAKTFTIECVDSMGYVYARHSVSELEPRQIDYAEITKAVSAGGMS